MRSRRPRRRRSPCRSRPRRGRDGAVAPAPPEEPAGPQRRPPAAGSARGAGPARGAGTGATRPRRRPQPSRPAAPEAHAPPPATPRTVEPPASPDARAPRGPRAAGSSTGAPGPDVPFPAPAAADAVAQNHEHGDPGHLADPAGMRDVLLVDQPVAASPQTRARRRPPPHGGRSSAAVAGNTSFTIQFAWQLQIGCMSFCFGTSQAQVAVQAGGDGADRGGDGGARRRGRKRGGDDPRGVAGPARLPGGVPRDDPVADARTGAKHEPVASVADGISRRVACRSSARTACRCCRSGSSRSR